MIHQWNFIVKISKGVLGSCIPLPGVKSTHAVTSVSENWLVEMLVTSICHQPLYPDSLLQQLGQSCPSLAQPLSRPLADNSRRHAGDPDIDASEQKMVVTTQTVGAQHDKELANIRALCWEKRLWQASLPCWKPMRLSSAKR